MYRYTLEKYSGGHSRYACPSCGRTRKFTRYIDTETGRYLANDVGRCDREAKCGYHHTPHEFFADNHPLEAERMHSKAHRKSEPTREACKPISVDYVSAKILKQTLRLSDRNHFIKFLWTRFPSEGVSDVVRDYLIGTWSDGRTVFWQIDARGRVRTGKLIAYDSSTGKRIKSRQPSWVHAELKRAGELPDIFNLRQCFFGEHLLPRLPERVVGLVESEKTAVVTSLLIPGYVWVATGGCGNLNLDRLGRAMRGRRIVLFPDSSKFEAWSKKAVEARRLFDLDVRVSDLLDQRLTEEQKRDDYDIADFLLRENADRGGYSM
jgi:hypothetical protein